MSGFGHFGREELLTFLGEIDRRLQEPAVLEIVGGAAAILAYGAQTATKDIDSFPKLDPSVKHAAQDIAQPIPIDLATLTDPPYNYEDRLVRLELPFRKLAVVVPDRHDLALMKVVRGYRHDIEVIQEIHGAQPLDLDILIERYETEMGQAVTDHRRLRLEFELLIEKLFGSKGLKRAKSWRSRR